MSVLLAVVTPLRVLLHLLLATPGWMHLLPFMVQCLHLRALSHCTCVSLERNHRRVLLNDLVQSDISLAIHQSQQLHTYVTHVWCVQSGQEYSNLQLFLRDSLQGTLLVAIVDL